MSLHPRAGQLTCNADLTNIPRLVRDYYLQRPGSEEPVSFGTSGHRGSSFSRIFTETHIAAICQALVAFRQHQGINGPLYLGMDTHALSECAFTTAIEVLVANGVHVVVQQGRGYTPTLVISHAILMHNACHPAAVADGIVITPSHNPPQDGGPADTAITSWVQAFANQLIAAGNNGVKRQPLYTAWASGYVTEHDYIKPYVDDLHNVIDMQAIADAGIAIGVDPLGGSGIAYWGVIAETYGLNLQVVNRSIDPTFSFMTLDKDGAIRMDCSSPYAMAGLIKLKDDFDVALANDPDYDRHGIVTPSVGLMNPNHYLAVAIQYLCLIGLNGPVIQPLVRP